MPETLDSAARDDALSPLEELIGKQTVDAYEEAMTARKPEEREAADYPDQPQSLRKFAETRRATQAIPL